ncbi:hypothetical protein RN001_003338 [Aquatica leii]|uniref:Nuclease HARBI1 n=1 Tax=Aquatica leii TaxID=1421715 RepID=A0AAN7PI61_9COLE|nr:hypothetical protein RN001_003338 [Aquatica leii]
MDAENIGFILLLDAIEEVEAVEEEVILREPRRFFQRNDAFTLGDIQFIKMFRLTNEMVRNIQTKVLVALKFYAGGSYQMDVESIINLAVSQPSVSRYVREVTTTLNNPQIMNQWVKFPNTIEDLQSIRRE